MSKPALYQMCLPLGHEACPICKMKLKYAASAAVVMTIQGSVALWK